MRPVFPAPARILRFGPGSWWRTQEAANEGGELFGEERLIRLVGSLPAHLTARETTEKLLDGVSGFLDGVEAGDDMTVMVLRVLDPQADGGVSDGSARVPACPLSAWSQSRSVTCRSRSGRRSRSFMLVCAVGGRPSRASPTRPSICP